MYVDKYAALSEYKLDEETIDKIFSWASYYVEAEKILRKHDLWSNKELFVELMWSVVKLFQLESVYMDNKKPFYKAVNSIKFAITSHTKLKDLAKQGADLMGLEQEAARLELSQNYIVLLDGELQELIDKYR